MAEQTEKFSLPYVRSPDFRTIVPDGINFLTLESGARSYIVLTATSDDIITEAEVFDAEVSEESVKQVGEREFKHSPRKVEHVALKLTPGLATNLVALLIRNLGTLAPDAVEQIRAELDKIESKK